MLMVNNIIVVVITTICSAKAAAVNENGLSVKYGRYENDNNDNIDIKMDVWGNKRSYPIINITFEGNGRTYTTGDITLSAIPQDGCHQSSTSKARGSPHLRLNKISEHFPRYRTTFRNFKICPKEDGSLIVKLMKIDNNYEDVRMTLTSAAAGGGEFTPRKKKEHVILTPGRYKSHQLPESSDIKSMHIDVSVGRPSKQTANISFFGGEDEKHDILNVPLKTYAPQWKAEKDEYYFYEKTPSPERDILVERFIEMGKKFPAALKRLRCGTSWIHINSKDTISFQVKDLSKKRTVATLSLMDDDDSIPKAVKRKTDDDESKVQGAKKRKQSKPVRIMKNYEIEEDEWDNTS